MEESGDFSPVDKLGLEIKESFLRIREGLLGWIAGVSFLPLFLSLCTVKLVDTFLAYVTYLYEPSVFMAREVNPFLFGAFVHGEIFPFLLVEALVYVLFGLIAASIVKISEVDEEFTSWVLSIPLVVLGVVILWLYPVTMSTNIVNGILGLGFAFPITSFLYVLTGLPLAWAVTRYGWSLESPYVAVFMIGVMFLISFQI